MLHLQKHLLPLLHAASPVSSSLHRLLLLSTSPTHFSIDDYLVATCHLTPAQVLKASKKLSHLKSPSKPDATLAFLAGIGLSRSDIAAVVAADPCFLCADVEKTLAPRLAALRGLGLSAPQIARFVLAGPVALRSCDITTKLGFWIPFFGSFDKLLQAMRMNHSILATDLDRVVKPNIEQLQQCGLSVCDIARMCLPASRLLLSRPERIKSLVLRAEKLGVPRGSVMFKYALSTVSCLKEERISMKMELLKRTLGCSEADLCIAVGKLPSLLRFSVEKLQRNMEFLLSEVGLKPEYIIHRPALLSFNLEERLVPRYCVVKILQAKELLKKDVDFFSVAMVSKKNFISKFVDCHKESVPGLADAYAAARARKIPAVVQDILKPIY